VKEGRTRSTLYGIPVGRGAKAPSPSFRRTFALPGLEEDRVYREVEAFLQLERALGQDARDISRYAFTEMLNNAIDHSTAKACTVDAGLTPYAFRFRIRDRGQGVFRTIATKFALPDEAAAVGELLKGKTTTMRERHSGEGIFFTSKAADLFTLRSHKLEVRFDNRKPDIVVREGRSMEGTEVSIEIGRRGRRKLAEVFALFAPEEFDYRFDRTRVHVRLYRDACVSRSEARRMLHGLGQFREVILDFTGVKELGQGFADEVFRVFRTEHPDTAVKTENLSPGLEPVIRHVLDTGIS
jgi:anti-sigma regulatory factor (Ser/Thr protein kinase)